MTKIIYTAEVMQIMSLFDRITHVGLKDCIVSDKLLVFIVPENNIGKAIGKNGRNVRILEKALKRKVKIVEFSNDVKVFTKNLLMPLKTKDVIDDDNTIIVEPFDTITRGQMIGRNAQNLRYTEGLIKRHFPIKELRINGTKVKRA
ncbi:NusA-like transcription termination signal-binding factor [Nanoarchaeota archaeon]